MNCVSVIVTPSFPEASSGGASGPAGGDLAGTYPNPTLAPPSVHGKTPKVTPDDGDELLIWDATTGELRRITRVNFLAGVSYTDEEAQDAIGGILTTSGTVSLVYNDVVPSITADVLDNAITAAKLAPDAVTAVKILDGAVTDAKLRDSSPTSVIGRSLGTAGDPADIVAAADEQVLRRASGVLGFGQVTTGGIADGTVTFAKVQTIATARLVGRFSSGTGPLEEITIGSNLSLVGNTLSATVSGWGTIMGPVLTGPFTVGAGTTLYTAPFVIDTNTTEALVQFPMPRPTTFRSLLITVSGTQGSDGALVYTMRKGGTDTVLQVTIPASATTGQFSDTTNTASFAFGDLMSISITNNSASPSITVRSIAFVADA